MQYLLRAGTAWARSLLHSLRRRTKAGLAADIIFVDYWTTSSAQPRSDEPASAWQSAYFTTLPDHLRKLGYSVAHLHIHADGPVTKPPSGLRQSLRAVGHGSVRHLLVSDTISLPLVIRAFGKWLRLQSQIPRPASVRDNCPVEGDLRRLLPWWIAKLNASLRGGHSVRIALLSEMFGRVVQANKDTALWILAFEGQNWEACLAHQLQQQDHEWLPYLHTMMRPWDLRARTFLSEMPPRRIVVHGPHDANELGDLGVPLVHVEALRYQHLSAGLRCESDTVVAGASRTGDSGQREWLVVGGADCEASRRELSSFLAAMDFAGVRRRVSVRWHPQCQQPSDQASPAVHITVEPLSVLTRRTVAALMVGSAAPLDTFLSGLPSCSLRASSGLEISPIPEGSRHHVADSAQDAVRWMLAAESGAGFAPPVAEYFTVDESLTRWTEVVRESVRLSRP